MTALGRLSTQIATGRQSKLSFAIHDSTSCIEIGMTGISDRFQWVRTNSFFGWSKAVMSWKVSDSEPIGTYRLRHSGCRKNLILGIKTFTGTSRSFTVTAKSLNTKSRYSLYK